MREIELTKGYKTMVDDEDYEGVSQHKWFAHVDYRGGVYARRQRRDGNKQVTVLMHREITGVPRGMEVDHIDGETLDNRRENLRVCTHSQNRKNTHGSHGDVLYKGVCYNKGQDRYTAKIGCDGKQHWIGYFKTPEEAALAYNDAARRYHGEYACLNEVVCG